MSVIVFVLEVADDVVAYPPAGHDAPVVIDLEDHPWVGEPSAPMSSRFRPTVSIRNK